MDKATYRNEVLNDVIEKTGNGGGLRILIQCKMIDYDSNEEKNHLKLYFIDGNFLVEYFKRMAFSPGILSGKVNKHNLGCNQCKKCFEFHRIKRLHDFSIEFKKNDNFLSEEIWKGMYTVVRSKC